MSCPSWWRAPFTCPTLPEIVRNLFPLLPRGRAWQTHDAGPLEPIERAFDPAVFDPEAFATRERAGSILFRWWKAFAAVLEFANARLCALRLEFWCATMSETRDLWLAEYGLPDACDPFPDLCVKVAAIGGTRCDYYAAIAARAGWSIRCEAGVDRCTPMLYGRDRFGHAGVTMGGGRTVLRLRILVDLGASVAYSGPRGVKPIYGRFRMGQRLSCGPQLSPLQCLLDRVVHAHIPIEYVTE